MLQFVIVLEVIFRFSFFLFFQHITSNDNISDRDIGIQDLAHNKKSLELVFS